MNKDVFKASQEIDVENLLTINHAGGKAYRLTSKQALAQMVNTGTFSNTFYANALEQLEQVLAFAMQTESEFLAKLAVYARQHGYMKDTPVLLLALLCTREDGQKYFKQIFNVIIDNGKQLRNFVQVMRSGVVGRKSLGNLAKNQVNAWILSASDKRFVSANLGNQPSLKDVIRLAHPKPHDDRTQALIRWAIGQEYQHEHLPVLVQQLLAFQQDNTQPLPDVPLQWLMSLDLTTEHWANIAKQGSWQMVRMNLNTFARHGVFEIDGMAEIIAEKLSDKTAIQQSRCFPYQLYTTWSALDPEVPIVVRNALKSAMITALSHVPQIEGNLVIAVDVSGSMSSSITGYRRGQTSVVRCVDVASLFATAMKYVNPTARIMPFDTQLRTIASLNDDNEQKGTLKQRIQARIGKRQPKEIDVFKMADELASLCGGGTHTALPMERLNKEQAQVDVMIYFSDNESWADEQSGRNTQMMKEWQILKQRCPQAKLICVDLQPYKTSQVNTQADILNVGGFSDQVFTMIALFCQKNIDNDFWVNEIEKITLPESK